MGNSHVKVFLRIFYKIEMKGRCIIIQDICESNEG